MRLSCEFCGASYPISNTKWARKKSTIKTHKMHTCPSCGKKNFYSLAVKNDKRENGE